MLSCVRLIHPLLVVSWHFRKVWFRLQEGPGWHQIARWFSMWVWNIYQVLKPMKGKTIYISVCRNSFNFFSLDKIQAGKEMHNVSTLQCNCAQTVILFFPPSFPLPCNQKKWYHWWGMRLICYFRLSLLLSDLVRLSYHGHEISNLNSILQIRHRQYKIFVA